MAKTHRNNGPHYLQDFTVRILQGVKYHLRGDYSKLNISEKVTVAPDENELTFKNVTIIGVPELENY